MSQNLFNLTAKEMISGIRDHRFTATQVIESCLARIKQHESKIHAWAFLDRESALEQAMAVDKKVATGRVDGALVGVPVGVKDIFNTKEMPTQMGSPIWADFTPGNDARVVHYLRMANAIIAGKTVTAEFAVHAPGPTTNPHNHAYMSGTSSSGSAAAVAAAMVPLALGTQTAGSTIRPASYCGIYGFKPSFGLIPRTGMLKTTDSLDTVGFFARSVEDLAIMFDVIRVHGLDYPISNEHLNDPIRQNNAGRPWRVALVRGPKWDDAEVYAQDAVISFAENLKGVDGVDIEEVKLSANFDTAHDIHATIYDRTLAYYFKEEFKKHTLVSQVMYNIVTSGNRITSEQYKQALINQNALAIELDEFFCDRFDVILTLATGGEPFKGLDSPDRLDTCLIWSLCGVTSINMPVFKGPNGLPFGAQVVSRRYNDYMLLAFVKWLVKQGLAPVKTDTP